MSVAAGHEAGAGSIAIGMLCKAPRPGAVKTRLCPPLSAVEAATLAAAFIADTAALVADAVAHAPGSEAVICHTPADGGEALAALLPAHWPRLAQRGADLGARLGHAGADLLARGHAAVCLIGTDSPTLPPALLRRAIRLLRRPAVDVVLGPALDGGYWLIGLKRIEASLFDGIAWSGPGVLTATLARCARAGLAVRLLPAWYDVDDAASLDLLYGDLAGGGLAATVRKAPAVHTRRVIATLGARDGGTGAASRRTPP